jgi:serine/threonine protein phosphatase PrpC
MNLRIPLFFVSFFTIFSAFAADISVSKNIDASGSVKIEHLEGIYPDKTKTFPFEVGSYSDQGERDYQEDRTMLKIKLFINGFSLSAVFDGHGGSRVAEFASKNLGEFVKREYEEFTKKNNCIDLFDISIAQHIEILKSAFAKINKVFNEQNYEDQGSTAIVVLKVNNYLIVANLGDSRALVRKDGEHQDLSVDHNGSNKSEVKRVIGSGGKMERWFGSVIVRVVSSDNPENRLAVTRAFGDAKFSEVIAVPEFWVYRVEEGVEFVLLVSDGAVSQLDNKRLSQIASQSIQESQSQGLGKKQAAEQAAEKVVAKALSRNKEDNTTVIVMLVDYTDKNPELTDLIAEFTSDQSENMEKYFGQLKKIVAEIDKDKKFKSNKGKMEGLAYAAAERSFVGDSNIQHLASYLVKGKTELKDILGDFCPYFEDQYRFSMRENKKDATAFYENCIRNLDVDKDKRDFFARLADQLSLD